MADIVRVPFQIEEISDPNIVPVKPFQVGGEITEGQSIEKGWDTAIATLSQPETVKQLQKAGFGLDDIDKQLENLRSFANAQKALAKQAELLEEQAEERAIDGEIEVIDEIFLKPPDEFVAGIQEAMDLVNSSTILPVKGESGRGKEGQRKKLLDRFNAIKSGKTDPINEFDYNAYKQLSTKITRNSKSVKFTDITSLVGLGINGGLTTDQARVLVGSKKFYDGADILGKNLHHYYHGAIDGLERAKIFNKNKLRNTNLATDARIALDAWAMEQESPTAEDYKKFYNGLIESADLGGWYRFFHHKHFEGLLQERQIQSYLGVAEEPAGDLGGLSDAELLKRITSD